MGLVVPCLHRRALAARPDRTGHLVVAPADPVLRNHSAVDLVTGNDDSNPPEEMIEALENDKYYRWVAYLFLRSSTPASSRLYFLAPATRHRNLSTIDKVGIAISLGTSPASPSTPPTSSATSVTNERWLPRSHWPRLSTATSSSSTTAAITCASRRRGPGIGADGREPLPFLPRTVVGLAQERLGAGERRYARRDSTRSGSATTCSTPG